MFTQRQNFSCKNPTKERLQCQLAPGLFPSAEAQHLWFSTQRSSKWNHIQTFTSPSLPFLLHFSPYTVSRRAFTRTRSCRKIYSLGQVPGTWSPSVLASWSCSDGCCLRNYISKQQSFLCAALFNRHSVNSTLGEKSGLDPPEISYSNKGKGCKKWNMEHREINHPRKITALISKREDLWFLLQVMAFNSFICAHLLYRFFERLKLESKILILLSL